MRANNINGKLIAAAAIGSLAYWASSKFCASRKATARDAMPGYPHTAEDGLNTINRADDAEIAEAFLAGQPGSGRDEALGKTDGDSALVATPAPEKLERDAMPFHQAP